MSFQKTDTLRMNFKIRTATEDDFSAVHRLNRAFADFIKTPEKFKITVRQMREEREFFKMFVAENDQKEIIGFATTFFAWYSWIGKSLYLDDIYIMDDYRGLGLGTKLMEAVFDLAKKEKCKKVRWQVSDWNAKAIEFYKKKGARIDGTEWNCDLIL